MVVYRVCVIGWIHLGHLRIHKYFTDDSSVNFHDMVFHHFFEKSFQFHYRHRIWADDQALSTMYVHMRGGTLLSSKLWTYALISILALIWWSFMWKCCGVFIITLQEASELIEQYLCTAAVCPIAICALCSTK